MISFLLHLPVKGFSEKFFSSIAVNSGGIFRINIQVFLLIVVSLYAVCKTHNVFVNDCKTKPNQYGICQDFFMYWRLQ